MPIKNLQNFGGVGQTERNNCAVGDFAGCVHPLFNDEFRLLSDDAVTDVFAISIWVIDKQPGWFMFCSIGSSHSKVAPIYGDGWGVTLAKPLRPDADTGQPVTFGPQVSKHGVYFGRRVEDTGAPSSFG
jgi:hypothetical protein